MLYDIRYAQFDWSSTAARPVKPRPPLTSYLDVPSWWMPVLRIHRLVDYLPACAVRGQRRLFTAPRTPKDGGRRFRFSPRKEGGDSPSRAKVGEVREEDKSCTSFPLFLSSSRNLRSPSSKPQTLQPRCLGGVPSPPTVVPFVLCPKGSMESPKAFSAPRLSLSGEQTATFFKK